MSASVYGSFFFKDNKAKKQKLPIMRTMADDDSRQDDALAPVEADLQNDAAPTADDDSCTHVSRRKRGTRNVLHGDVWQMDGVCASNDCAPEFACKTHVVLSEQVHASLHAKLPSAPLAGDPGRGYAVRTLASSGVPMALLAAMSLSLISVSAGTLLAIPLPSRVMSPTFPIARAHSSLPLGLLPPAAR